MTILAQIKDRFRPVLAALVEDPAPLLDMIRPAQDARFGDFQANCAMPLSKQLGRSSREIAEEIAQQLDVAKLCEEPEVAGPGFINLRLRQDWLVEQLSGQVSDSRLGVETAAAPQTYVIDYSSPNVAKPMHVGHIRSTVIGDALARTLKFLGHRVIRDNHLGDWGTQFGMIIYGFKHFSEPEAYTTAPVNELTRLYKLVNRLVEYHACKEGLSGREEQVAQAAQAVEELSNIEGKPDKKARRAQQKAQDRLIQARALLEREQNTIAEVEDDSELSAMTKEHATIGHAVLEETAKLHAGDAENRRLWDEFIPKCLEELDKTYERLEIDFDVQHGESFPQNQLASVVKEDHFNNQYLDAMKKNQHEEMVEAREGLARWLSKNRLLHHERTILEIAGQ